MRNVHPDDGLLAEALDWIDRPLTCTKQFVGWDTNLSGLVEVDLLVDSQGPDDHHLVT